MYCSMLLNPAQDLSLVDFQSELRSSLDQACLQFAALDWIAARSRLFEKSRSSLRVAAQRRALSAAMSILWVCLA